MNKLAVAISGLAIVAVIALILGITLTTDRRRNGDKLPYASKSGEPITFDEFLSYEFSAKSFNGSWFSNNQIQWRDKENNLVLWNVNTNETTILVGADTVGQVSKQPSLWILRQKIIPNCCSMITKKVSGDIVFWPIT